MTTVGICGAGIGGLTAAIALREQGLDVRVYEQTRTFGRVGADINLTPNAVRALDGIGVGAVLRESAARPRFRISRMWDTGAETSRLPMSDTAEKDYGAPQLTLHRADLLAALEERAPGVRMGTKLQTVTFDEGAELHFADGSTDRVDVLVGADGIHSAVRTALLGPDHPTFTGIVAFRAVVPTQRLAGLPDLDCFTKWWGPEPDTQIVTFPLNEGGDSSRRFARPGDSSRRSARPGDSSRRFARPGDSSRRFARPGDTFVFATRAQDAWREESWTTPGSVAELRALYADFHPDARALLDACDTVLKSALYVREPLSGWTNGTAVLLGDAAHPMMPFMAQGAGQAIEDAVVLARCLGAHVDPAAALATYQDLRLERTATIQRGSRANDWLKSAGTGDWVYGYDAWRVPVDAA